MAGYNVDLEIAVKNAKELQKTRVGVKQLQREIRRFNKEAQQGTKVVKNFKNLEEVVGRSKAALNTAAIGTSKFNKAVKALAKSELTYSKEMANRNRALENAKRAQLGMQSIEEREHQLLMRGNRLRDLRLKKERMINKTRGMRGRGLGGGFGNALGSGIIGGGFPLLFGQGPTAAIGGALGGIGGGLIGGQFGFALSIAGTTIGSALDDLAKALAKPTENIEKLVQKFGLSGTATGDLALELEKLGLKSSAAKLLLEKGAEQLGLTTEEVELNTEKMQEFENAINKLGTQITLFLANNLTPFLEKLSEFGKKPREILEQAIMGPEGRFEDYFGTGGNFFEKALSFLMFGPGGDPTQQFERFKKKYLSMSNIPVSEGNAIINGVPINPDFGKPGITASTVDPNKPASDLARKTFEEKELLPLKQKLELEQNRLLVSSDKLNLMKEEFELTNIENELQRTIKENEKLSSDELDKKIEKLKIARDTQLQVVENTKKLIDPFRQISGIIAQDIGDGIRGLIRGTETLGNLLNNVINKLADAFINMAIFGNFGGTFERGSGLLGSIFKANGGAVKGGGSYVVGERGPEVFSPGVSGTITPNHALGGSTTVVVNVDASGTEVQGDEEQGRELGRLISAAVQSELIQQKRPGGILA